MEETDIIEENDTNWNKIFYEINESENTKILKYKILNNGDIILYIQIGYSDDKKEYKIIFNWFKSIDNIEWFKERWYITSNFWYYIWNFLSSHFIEIDFYDKEVIIVKEWCTKIENEQLFLSYEDYLILHKKLYSYKWNLYLPNKRHEFIYNHLNGILNFEIRNEKEKKIFISKLIWDIDEWMVDFMTDKQKEKIELIYQKVLDSWYLEKVESIRKKIDLTHLDSIIATFKTNINNSRIWELRWWEFLEKNLFLIYWKYIEIIKELSVEDISRRKVDFWLIDSYWFLDIFEIKKPNTKLLSNSIDRWNHYWHNETIKAIVQAEKYVYDIEKNSNSVKNKILKKIGWNLISKWDIEVIKPKVYLIIWDTKQLDNEKKQKDFRILKNWLKNVEIITYDELLNTLINLRAKLIR